MTGADGSWQARYDADAKQDQARQAAWVHQRFGGPPYGTVLRELPWALGLLVVGGLFISWTWGVVLAVAYLVVGLATRWWARRRYGITGEGRADRG